ncbi:MAG: hypothetical protein OEX12_01305 [Gammaproteobacteria bacterium]|nr:hypothetical protein [Gammaproteobacteria bacterium]
MTNHDKWFSALDDCTFSDLKAYFAQPGWNKAGYYWTAASCAVNGIEYIDKAAGDRVKRTQSGMPIVRYSGRLGFSYKLPCPFDREEAEDVIREHLEPMSDRRKIRIFCPNYWPSGSDYDIYYRDPEAVYDCQHIVDNIDRIMGKRGMSYIRRYNRECEYRLATPEDADLMEKLLDEWYFGNGGQKKKNTWHRSNRQIFQWLRELGETALQDRDMLLFLAIRNGEHPVAMSAISPMRFPGYPGWGVQFMAKALNYRTSPGGGNNMAGWELYRCAQECLKYTGLRYLNGGGYDMRSSQYQAIRKWKEKFSNGGVVENNQWYWNWTATKRPSETKYFEEELF